MEDQRRRMFELLKSNEGFDVPEKWIDYGIAHNFQRIAAERREECPDCSGREYDCIGQYVYYSTLIRLNECLNCGLVFSDTLIDPSVINSHFESSYKDEDYFQTRRSRIFGQIAKVADGCTPTGGSVLDIGGAKGHLLDVLRKRRPDLKLVLNDLSKDACAFAASQLGLDVVCGDLGALENIPAHFNTIVLSDVLYYEPRLRELWKLIPKLICDGGSVVIRVPNKLPLIRFVQSVRYALSPAKRDLQSDITLFNPEHIYIFSQGYLLSRLRQLGFPQPVAMPSELLKNRGGFWQVLDFHLARALSAISLNRIVVTPSLLIVASDIQRSELPSGE